MDNEQKLYNEDILQALKDVLRAIKRQETKVNVEAPNISVEPTPVVVESKEVSLDTTDLKNALQGITTRLNEKLEVNVANQQAQTDKIEVKNLKQIETLLKQLIAKETVIKVDAKAGDVSVNIPTSFNPKEYIPVRLTDGEQFYNAITALASAGGSDKRFTFTNGKLNVNTEVTRISYAVDKDDATNYYFGSYLLDSSWRIERMNKATGISDYATGSSDIVSAWQDRITQTYGLLT